MQDNNNNGYRSDGTSSVCIATIYILTPLIITMNVGAVAILILRGVN